MESHTKHASVATRLMRLAALGGMVGPVLFVVIVMLGGWLTDGYSHTGQKISELGGSGAQYAPLQNVNFIVLGILMVGFTWALGRHLGSPYHGVVLLGLFGIFSCIANGLLPCDAACIGETPVGMAHNMTGLLGFFGAISGMIVLARRWRQDPRWQHHIAPTIGAIVVVLAGLSWFIATQATDPNHWLGGLAQRIFVGALLLWITRTAWLLKRQLTGANHAAPTERTTTA